MWTQVPILTSGSDEAVMYSYRDNSDSKERPHIESASLHFKPKSGVLLERFDKEGFSWCSSGPSGQEDLESYCSSLSASILRARVLTDDARYAINVKFYNSAEIRTIRNIASRKYTNLLNDNLRGWINASETFDSTLDGECKRCELPSEIVRLLVEDTGREKLSAEYDLSEDSFRARDLAEELRPLARNVRLHESRERKIGEDMDSLNQELDCYKNSAFTFVTSVQRGRVNGKPLLIPAHNPLTPQERETILPAMASWLKLTLPNLEPPFQWRAFYATALHAHNIYARSRDA